MRAGPGQVELVRSRSGETEGEVFVETGRDGETVAGVMNDSGSYLGIFTGFPIEAIVGDVERGDFISRAVNACHYRHNVSVGYVAPESAGDGAPEVPMGGDDVF